MGKDSKNDHGIEKLGSSAEYESWAYRMENLLEKLDFWDLIDRTETCPAGAETSKAVKDFTKRQKKTKAEIIEHVDDSQLPHTRFDDPADIWDKLKTVHQPRGIATALMLRRKLHRIRKAPEQTMQSWITTVQEIVRRIEDLGSTVSAEEEITALTKLPKSYKAVIVTFDAISASGSITVDEVIARLINEEAGQLAEAEEENEHRDPDSALYAHHRGSNKKAPRDLKEITCFKCSKKGHYAADCPDDKPKETANLAIGAIEDDSGSESAF